MATTFESSFAGQKIVSVNPIPDQIKRLEVISCDYCNGKASFDVYLEGMISEVNVLKRSCDDCIKRFSPQAL